jgi:3-deoxy-D-manno-octulosonic-acid transferase
VAARLLYNALLPVAVAGVRVASWFLPKVREAIAGRRGFRERWSTLRVDGAERPVWFHVSSVGEFEQARPVISAIERRFPRVPVILTFSSPSGYHFAMKREKVGDGAIRFIDYLPADTRGNMRMCLSAANPRLLVLVKFDLWPNLVWEAKRAGVPVVLIAATLSPSSRRLSAIGRWFYGRVYASLDRILAISEDDAGRFRTSTPDHPAIAVAGDTRFDRVMERWEKRDGTRLDIASAGGPVVIAGSTWPADEAHLLGALRSLLGDRPALRVIIAPHEPVAAHVEPLVAWARSCGWKVARVSDGPVGADSRVVVLDTVGVLAEAYRLGDVAYVGGSFSTGVHSVIEPAIAGMPVVFGPVHDNSFEALQLLERGAAASASDEDGIRERIGVWIDDREARERAGQAARAYVEGQTGASEKCMAVLGEFL